MPLKPPLSLEARGPCEKKSSVMASFNGKKNLKLECFLNDKRFLSSSKNDATQSLGDSLRGAEDEARRKGRAVQLTIVQKPKTAARSSPKPTGELLSSLPKSFSSNAKKTFTTQPKNSFTVTSASIPKAQPLSSPHEKAQPPSLFDDVPVQTCLEYLTRPHRSWESAVRLREVGSKRLMAWKRRDLGRCLSSDTSESSTRLSSALFSTTTSASGLTACSAPAKSGGSAWMNSRNSRGCSALRSRGRFGVLPGIKFNSEDLVVGGCSVAQSGSQLALTLTRGSSLAATSSFASSDVEKRGLTAPTLRRVREFGFKMH